VAYVDFRAAFDSVNRQSLWLLLKTKGVPQKLIDLLEDLYINTVSCVRVDGQFRLVFDICRGAPRLCCCSRLVFGTNRLDNQSLRSPRLRAFRSQDYWNVVCQKLWISDQLSSRYRRLNSDSFLRHGVCWGTLEGVAVVITVYITVQGSYINLTVVFMIFQDKTTLFQTIQGIFMPVYINNITKKLT